MKEVQVMAIPPRNLKSLQDIRTHAGRVDEAAIPYKAFMKMSCLEMEKFRKERERNSAMTRVNNIDKRFREIEAEKAAIRTRLDGVTEGRSKDTDKADPKPPARQTPNGFRLRY
jgi:hypothetical protein